jgi:hypothetical protein
LLPAADLFLLTSVSEGIPLAVIEAMAAGLPVVATRVGGVGEVVEYGRTGLLAPAGDHMALAGNILRLAEAPQLREQMGQMGRQRARALFSEEQMNKSYWQLYQQMLAVSGSCMANLTRRSRTRFVLPILTAMLLGTARDLAADASLPASDNSPAKTTINAPDVAVRFLIGINQYTARPPKTATADRWLAGPLVTEWRATVAPRHADGTEHPFLRVLFDLRAFRDGQFRIDITVENTLDKDGAATVTYDVEIVAGEKSLFHRDRVQHHYLTRWRQVFEYGMAVADFRPDLESFYQAGALPRFLNQIGAAVDKWGGAKFDILGGGNLDYYMPDHGGRAELAPYPDWVTRYVVYKNSRQREYVLVNGDLAGSWPVHLREASDGRLLSIDDHPNYWLDPRADAPYRPAGRPIPDPPYSADPRRDPAKCPLLPDNAHQPSLAYVPYLITGDRYYADEMKFWANFGLLRTWQDPRTNMREGSAGLLFKANEPRGVAWVLRNLVDAAAYLPDDDPLKPYLAKKIAHNLTWIDEWAKTKQTSLGPAWLKFGEVPLDKQDRVWISPPQNHFLAWSLDHANDQGFTGGQIWRDQIARFTMQLFTSPGWRRENAAPYRIAIGEALNAKIELDSRLEPGVDDSVRYYTTFAESHNNTFRHGEQAEPFAGWYGHYARLMLLIGMRNGWVFARAGYEYLNPFLVNRTRNGGPSDMSRHPGWALAAPSLQSTAIEPFVAQYRLYQGWATFGLVVPQGVARTGLKIDGLEMQADIKTHWPDGSIRFAVITAAVPKAGLYKITSLERS